MKIVFVIGSLGGGGAERVLVLLANEFSKRNFEVTIITKIEGCAYELSSNIYHKTIFSQTEMNSRFVNKINRRLKFIYRLTKEIKSEKPDIVISFITEMNAKVILISKLLNIPVLASEHNNYKARVNFLTWFERRWIYKIADAVTVLTKYDYEMYYKCFLHNVFIMPNPVTFGSIEKVGRRDKSIIASGYLNRWSQKGFDNLIKIFSNISQRYPDWTLKLAGGGKEGEDYLIKLAKKFKVKDNIKFLGFCNNIDEVLQQSPIYVLSSRYEGFPMVLIEAMSQGCACVSFDCVSGPREIITNGVDGILVEDQNMKQMEDEICRLIADENLRLLLTSNAIRNIKRFSLDKIVNKWERLINKIHNEKIELK